MIEEQVTPKGEVEAIIDYIDGRQEKLYYKNTVLRTGKNTHISGLVNNFGNVWQFFVNSMIFGTNGAVGGVPLEVMDTRTGLFGSVLLQKPVVSAINSSAPNQGIFTAVVAFGDGNGYVINEMALQMNSGDLYSMITMGGISKTSSMQVTFNWRTSMV